VEVTVEWSGDLYEVTWFFFRSFFWSWRPMRRHYTEKYLVIVFTLGYWNLHVSYTKD
jgi:hypothetical protein